MAKSPDNLYGSLLEQLQAGETVALATVVATRGSTPREVGAKMLVRRTGAIVGTVGGGCGEAQVWRTALQVIETGEPQTVPVDLTGEISMDSAAVCGGTMEVLVEPWGAGTGATDGHPDLEVASLLVERYRRREPSVLATVVAVGEGAPCRVGDHALVAPDGTVLRGLGSSHLDDWLGLEAARAVDAGGYVMATSPRPSAPEVRDRLSDEVRLGLEVVRQPPLLVVVGAGHISVPLAQIGKLLGFAVAVLDDRAAFANAERFPEADTVLAMGFGEALQQLPIDGDSYVVLVTRGHQHDVECLRKLIATDAAYIGMIGSRRRVRAVFELLRQERAQPERLASVHAPIGIDIAAQTPAEIAVSIAAEIVNVRRGGQAPSLKRHLFGCPHPAAQLERQDHQQDTQDHEVDPDQQCQRQRARHRISEQ